MPSISWANGEESEGCRILSWCPHKVGQLKPRLNRDIALGIQHIPSQSVRPIKLSRGSDIAFVVASFCRAKTHTTMRPPAPPGSFRITYSRHVRGSSGRRLDVLPIHDPIIANQFKP